MELGVHLHLITPEMHHSNGQVVRFCRTLLNMVRLECNHRSNKWSDVIDIQMLFEYNKKNHQAVSSEL